MGSVPVPVGLCSLDRLDSFVLPVEDVHIRYEVFVLLLLLLLLFILLWLLLLFLYPEKDLSEILAPGKRCQLAYDHVFWKIRII